MSRPIVLITLGILIALTPYSGLPLSILSIILPVLGLIVAGVGFIERARGKHRTPPVQVVPTYEAPES